MKKLEEDLLVLSSIWTLCSQSGIKLSEHIPNYEKDKVVEMTLSTFTDEKVIDQKLIEIANNCYKRIQKKLPQK